MSNMAHDHDALNLSQGFPDFSAPAELLELINQHMLTGHNQYAPMPGLPKLREQIAIKIRDIYGRSMSPETEITVTSGGTEALFSAIEAFVHPGDEVIVFDPAYDSYDPAVRLAGGHAIHLPLVAPGFSVDWDRVAHAVSSKTRMIVLNTPHNPTGAVLSGADMTALAEIVRDTDIILLGDEVYEHIIFDYRRHESLHYHPELVDRSLIVSSFGKTYHATGWKIGYCVAPEPLMLEFRRVHQFVQFCVVTPMQFGLADYMESSPEHCHQLADFYQEKRDHFARLLDGSRFRLTPSAGTYFQLADYSEISADADIEFTRWMTTEKGVATIPVSVFYESPPEQQYIRFCFAKNENTLEQAAELLCAI
ncbi:MAG: methionine aminotransferase [Gammaproteobacteria bacterium]|jgi:methionine aminotransferase|nr:methionine aminotransferase [Gammaproteobacteria bacterium]MDP6617300.1 methionine aminotransferase [Gammaproteobacteria bacterium]MDP6694078.1 methionine aminotransferase [Gammaproteobacteria bacterium]